MNGGFNFKQEFIKTIEETYKDGLDWSLVGILTKEQNVYTLSYDSKVLSGIFEILCEPLIKNIADKYNLLLEKAKQNQYPEFTLYSNKHKNHKIAIDVKSTYRQYTSNNELKPFSFTLGSYRSFLRDPSGRKGILYPYKEYKEHWVIGFLYTRNLDNKFTEIKQVIEASQLIPPFTDFEYFVQEKYKIAGDKPGSGNTTNIGSIKSNNIEDFQKGKGIFRTHKEFENYWRNY